jgi:hypothetical protein
VALSHDAELKDLQPGARIDDFTHGARLHAGAMGALFRVTQAGVDRPMVMKLPRVGLPVMLRRDGAGRTQSVDIGRWVFTRLDHQVDAMSNPPPADPGDVHGFTRQQRRASQTHASFARLWGQSTGCRKRFPGCNVCV